MAKEELVEATGVIIDTHKGGLFTVEIDVGDEKRTVIARPSGKMKKYKIKLLLQDVVDVELTPYDLTKGRITYRRHSG